VTSCSNSWSEKTANLLHPVPESFQLRRLNRITAKMSAEQQYQQINAPNADISIDLSLGS
jgi:hypothetical protein